MKKHLVVYRPTGIGTIVCGANWLIEPWGSYEPYVTCEVCLDPAIQLTHEEKHVREFAEDRLASEKKA